MPDFTFVGNHAQDLHDGRMLEPNQQVSLTAEETQDEHNKRLIDEGLLLPQEEAKSEPKSRTGAGKGGED